jgi:hypothetical protein
MLTGVSTEELTGEIVRRTQVRPAVALELTGAKVALQARPTVVVKKRVDNVSELHEIMVDFNRLQGRLARFVNHMDKSQQ